MKKLIALALFASLFCAQASFAAKAAQDEGGIDESMFEEEKTPAKKKKKSSRKGNVKEIEAQKSVEAQPPAPPAGLSAGQLQMLSDILAATQLENAQMQLEALQLKRAEQRNKIMEVMNPELVEARKNPPKSKEDEAAEKMARVFPMPGGNPQVISILGGSRKALEATLLFPSGLRYEVGKGTVLEGGYKVVNVSNNGVVMEKNGMRLSMPISGGTMKGKPWDDGQEMGTPIDVIRQPMPIQPDPTASIAQ